MIGPCKLCRHICKNDFPGDFGCIKFGPGELLLESEIIEWMQLVKHQECKTAEAIIKTKRKFIRNGDNCIQIEKEPGDILIIPIDDDYLDYARDFLDEFIGDADFNDLAIGDKITFTFMRMSDKEYEEMCEENDD